MTFTIMSGLPESGKTTKAAALAAETGATLIRHDDYYSTVFQRDEAPTYEMLQQVAENVYADIKAHLLSGEDVIYDAPNVSKAARKRVLDACAVEGCFTRCVYMDTPLAQCNARSSIGWPVIFSRSLEVPTEEEGFNEVIISADGRDAE